MVLVRASPDHVIRKITKLRFKAVNESLRGIF